MADDPSLGRFVLDRLHDEEGLILRNTPLWLETGQVSPEFEEAFLDRGALTQRARRDRDLVLACMEAMKREQEDLLILPTSLPVTELGTEIIKRIAATYQSHPDYQTSWSPPR